LPPVFHAGIPLGLLFDPEDGGDVPPKLRLTFNGLHGVVSQKIVLFTCTGVDVSEWRHTTFASIQIVYNKGVMSYRPIRRHIHIEHPSGFVSLNRRRTPSEVFCCSPWDAEGNRLAVALVIVFSVFTCC
jgi:hypothetical protein